MSLHAATNLQVVPDCKMSDDLNRQLRTRLVGLAAAGVDWLPRVEAPAFVPARSRSAGRAADRQLTRRSDESSN